ncbi:MAG: MBL fold metallo-hydrolase [Gammaproteobacteria bacterium]|nr:MBL fold metallo-hydrolase [Gammaproteobacteria bacterium]
MTIQVEFLGAAGEVTGSCHLVQAGDRRILLDCGLIQGQRSDEDRNRQPFPFDPKTIDAVVLSHAHIDHSGRLPMLVKAGFKGHIYTHSACQDLCRIMLKDSAFLNEKETEWENRKRLRKGLKLLDPLYTEEDVKHTMKRFRRIPYLQQERIFPNIAIRLNNAGHILGSSIIELWLEENGDERKLVFSGDLGRPGMPILNDPALIRRADLVIMESTYGDRCHRSWQDTRDEMAEVLSCISNGKGNILIPAFAVGRTQEILYLFAKYYKEWGLDNWEIFLDSPLAIQATEVFTHHSNLFNPEMAALWEKNRQKAILPNLHISRTTNQSMALNRVTAGAIIIAGSGMCTGGRIKQHFKHNLWRKECHIVITGFQARGTLGRMLVDGAKRIRLWGETIQVNAKIHTIGGLSAHADEFDLRSWYSNFENHPPVVLVHGEDTAFENLSKTLKSEFGSDVTIAQRGQRIDLMKL